MSVRHQPAVAFEPGWVEKWSHPAGAVPSCMLVLHGKSGMVYWYIHLNNDRGPDNDNDAGCRKAYAPGLDYHDHVSRGQLVGFVGDSGDANGIQPHLHFEVHKANGTPINPFQYLNDAKHLLFPRPAAGSRRHHRDVEGRRRSLTRPARRSRCGPSGSWSRLSD